MSEFAIFLCIIVVLGLIAMYFIGREEGRTIGITETLLIAREVDPIAFKSITTKIEEQNAAREKAIKQSADRHHIDGMYM